MTHVSALEEIAVVVLNLPSVFKNFERMREMQNNTNIAERKSLNFQVDPENYNLIPPKIFKVD